MHEYTDLVREPTPRGSQVTMSYTPPVTDRRDSLAALSLRTANPDILGPPDYGPEVN